MQRDIDFAIWCANKCLHLWDAPDEVKDWLEDPKPETADAAWAAEEAAVAARAGTAARAAWAAACATWAATWAASTTVTVLDAAAAVKWAAKALNTTVADLRLEYVKTWTDDELANTSDEWIEAVTIELFDRESKCNVT